METYFAIMPMFLIFYLSASEKEKLLKQQGPAEQQQKLAQITALRAGSPFYMDKKQEDKNQDIQHKGCFGWAKCKKLKKKFGRKK